jgi:hypothetical protein
VSGKKFRERNESAGKGWKIGKVCGRRFEIGGHKRLAKSDRPIANRPQHQG